MELSACDPDIFMELPVPFVAEYFVSDKIFNAILNCYGTSCPKPRKLHIPSVHSLLHPRNNGLKARNQQRLLAYMQHTNLFAQLIPIFVSRLQTEFSPPCVPSASTSKTRQIECRMKQTKTIPKCINLCVHIPVMSMHILSFKVLTFDLNGRREVMCVPCLCAQPTCL